MKKNFSGFTLVEISIVMIIIGLLIGGTFGGMKLVENMQVNKTVQDLKAIEAAGVTFKDTYGRLPGDITNPSTRLPNCTTAPCSTGGNGNRIIGTWYWSSNQAATDETFTFWSHLLAADLISFGIKNTTDLNFGEGQPEMAIGGGMRMNFNNVGWNATSIGACPQIYGGAFFFLTGEASGNATNATTGITISCRAMRSMDTKIDDAMPLSGNMQAGQCLAAYACGTGWSTTSTATLGSYDLRGF